MPDYSPETIKNLADAIAGDRSSRTYLILSENKELAALVDVIIDRNASAIKWLIDHQHGGLVLFYNALRKETGAIDELLKHDQEKVWSTVIYAMELDADALDWLIKSNLEHYAYLARRLYKLKKAGFRFKKIPHRI